jgi:hypothetical protein
MSDKKKIKSWRSKKNELDDISHGRFNVDECVNFKVKKGTRSYLTRRSSFSSPR